MKPSDSEMDSFKTEFSDILVLQSEEAPESEKEESIPYHHRFHLLVSDLPPSITVQELQEFFQDRKKSGGGQVTHVDLNTSAGSAAVFFSDEQVILQVLQRVPLLLKDKIIQVQVSANKSNTTQPAEPEIKTVEIRGLEAEEETEMCLYYFGNPMKGGGNIEHHEWNKQDKIFFITFTDPEVAKTVSVKGHKLGGKVLEVKLYTPPAEEPAEEAEPQCTVEVRGIDPSQTELYEMYFSNPNKGGGTIIDLRLSEDQSVLYITFEMPEVAQHVADMPHKVGGRQLEVTVAAVEDPAPPCTVLVRGCDISKDEILRYYFENPNMGGGIIADMVIDREQEAIRITFVDPKVAETIVARHHKVSGRDLEVSLYSPKKALTERQKSQEPSAEEAVTMAPLCTVVVSLGNGHLEREDTYRLYFESPRFGGGQVEKVEFDTETSLTYITFVDPAVAERVARQQHRIVGHPAEVKLYVPPKPKPTYPNKLLFQNVADSTTQDCLSLHLEWISGMEPQQIVYGDEVGTVLVTFPKEPDFASIQKMSQKRALEKRYLTVSRVPISNCVLVEGLCERTTEETLQLYFENTKRSNGGPVERVEMMPKENKCFVYFESHEVLDGVLDQRHILDDQELRVKCYLECLGQSGGSEDPAAFTMPKPLVLSSLDPFKFAFLCTQPEVQQQFFKGLSVDHAKGTFMGNTLVVECTLTLTVPKARMLLHTWTMDIEEKVSSFLGQLEVKKRHMAQQLWNEVEPALREANAGSRKGACLIPVPEDSTLVVVGMQDAVQKLYSCVDVIVKAKEDEMERRKLEVTETNSKLSNSQLGLLRAIGFHTDAGKRHKGLKVDIQMEKKTIVFHGLLNAIKEAKVEMEELLNTMKTGKISGVKDMQMRLLLTKGTKKYIINKFKNDKIYAIWEEGQKNEVNVFAFDDKSMENAVHLIKSSVQEHVHHLSPESSQLLRTQDWQNLLTKLAAAHPPDILLITPFHDSLQIFITCIDRIMHPVVEEIEMFMAENTIYSQTVCFSPSRQKLVHMQWKDKIQTLTSNIRAWKVQFAMTESGDQINIKGTRKGLEEVLSKLEELNQKIVYQETIFEDLESVKVLTSDCKNDLNLIGRSYNCVLSLQAEDAELKVIGSGGTATPVGAMQISSSDNMEAAASVKHNSVTISIIQGDITQMAVGAIVNAANTRMHHAGGLAGDIVKKGGDIIQQECYKKLQERGQELKEGDVLMSGPGRLPCQCIIHAVGPMYKGGNSGEQDCLFETVMTCLQTGNDKTLSSIAIPAISTGIFGYPAEESTRVILEAVKAFLDSHRRCTIKSIYLCHLGTDIVRHFTTALKKIFPSGFSRAAVRKGELVPEPQYTQTYRSSQPPTQGFYNQPSPVATALGRTSGQLHKLINVSVIPGEIARQSADVIVNSASQGLELSNGAVSASILKAAGQQLQAECKSKYPAGIQTGGMARTNGHNLSCKEIFHVVLCNYTNPQAQQVLQNVVTTCLSDASTQGYTSIAFPVLGTGNLRFPSPVVAQTMLDSVYQFEQTNPSTPLRDVRIVVYPTDTAILQAFQQAHAVVGQGFPATSSFGLGTGGRQRRQFSDSGSQVMSPGKVDSGGKGSNSAEFDIGGLRFVIKKGDITEEDTDAIVNSTNSDLDMRRGGVAGALRKKCGPQLEHECRSRVHAIQNTGITVTHAYNLKSKKILHMNADLFSNNWEIGIERCFQMAEQNGLRSIAMPALGTGIGLSADASAIALFNTVVRMYKHGRQPSSLEEVRVVLFDSKMITPFINAVQQTGDKHNRSRQGFFRRIKSAFTGESVVEVKQMLTANKNHMVETVTLYIYAEKQSDINEALKELDNLAKQKFTRKEIQDEVIHSFNTQDEDSVMMISERHKAEVQIFISRGTIWCDGLHKQVYDCVDEIKTYIRTIHDNKKQREAEAMLAGIISWCFLEVTLTGTVQQEYQPKENYIIEMAYRDKKTQAEIKDTDGNVYIIDFNTMEEYPKNRPNDSVTVIRKDKIKDMAGGQLPESWTPHSANETVKLVTLNTTDPEYQTVAQGFGATVRNVQISSIQRVQNPLLYLQYIAKKAYLEKQNPGIQNEKILWHGTSADAITNINHHGFNRSYCGKNATVHGNGVYFAINASYSASPTYSPPDPSGNRYIYQCKVLVGCPTVGQQNLRVLPARQGPILYDSATDNTNSPSMYVIFNDTQAYPDYMITFR